MLQRLALAVVALALATGCYTTTPSRMPNDAKVLEARTHTNDKPFYSEALGRRVEAGQYSFFDGLFADGEKLMDELDYYTIAGDNEKAAAIIEWRKKHAHPARPPSTVRAAASKASAACTAPAGRTPRPADDDGATTTAGVVDVVGVVVYALEPDFTVASPAVLALTFDELADAFPGQEIFIQELGMHTPGEASAALEQAQADGFCAALHAWDAHAEQMPFVNIVRLNDVSEGAAMALAGPYGVSDPNFIEYLRTLGLRTAVGSPKRAFLTLVDGLRRRGLGND